MSQQGQLYDEVEKLKAFLTLPVQLIEARITQLCQMHALCHLLSFK